MTVTLTGSVRYEKFTPEKMNEPEMREAIAACERSGGGRCAERAIAGEARSRFVRGEDERVHVFIELAGLEGGRSYEFRVRWFGPDGGVTSRMSRTMSTPSKLHRDFVYHANFWANVSRMPVGRWRVELSINGEVEADRSFEIVASAQAHGGPLDLTRGEAS